MEKIKLIIAGDPLQLPPIDGIYGYFFNGSDYEDFEKQSYICKLTEEFADLSERVRFAIHTDDDVKYIKQMKNNNVDENEAVNICAKKIKMLR